MHVWIKSEITSDHFRLHQLLVLWLFLQAQTGFAQTSGIVIRNVNGVIKENIYVINADIDYRLSAETEKALKHGIPLQFDVKLRIRQLKHWLLDKTVSSVLLQYGLQYHPLSGNYLVTNINAGQRQQFQNLADAMGFLGKLRDYPLVSRDTMDANGDYYGQIMAQLNIRTLPTPLRPLAYISADWRLASSWFAWNISL
jgi:hypothetical protein